MDSASTWMIDLRKGHPKNSSLPHLHMARACRAAAERLDSSSEASFPLQYESSRFGTTRFEHALRAYLSDAYKGAPVLENWILTTNGVSHGIDLVVGALSSPGDLVILEVAISITCCSHCQRLHRRLPAPFRSPPTSLFTRSSWIMDWRCGVYQATALV